MLRRLPTRLQSIRGAASRLGENFSMDPISAQMQAMGFGAIQNKRIANLDGTVSLEQAKKWMEIKHAARILNVKEDELYGLRPEAVHTAWRTVVHSYPTKLTEAGIGEATVAAECLLDYVSSDMHHAKTKIFYMKQLQVERKRLQDDMRLQAKEQGYFAMRYLGVFFTICCFTIIIGGAIIHKLHPERISTLQVKLGRKVKQMSNLFDDYKEPVPPQPTMAEDVPVVKAIRRHDGNLYDEMCDDQAKDLQRERDLIAQFTTEQGSKGLKDPIALSTAAHSTERPVDATPSTQTSVSMPDRLHIPNMYEKAATFFSKII